jgi:hypothetical protein
VKSMHAHLAPGKPLAARGDGVTNALGAVVDAEEIGASLASETRQIEEAA